MKSVRSDTAEQHQLRDSFEAVRRTLMDEGHVDELDKPLAFWALPNDRRLPLALLGRSVRELLTTPFDKLTSTPGIGRKKINSLITLLHRAADTGAVPPPHLDPVVLSNDDVAARPIETNGTFEAAAVSEPSWQQWRETVRRHDLGMEKLGRLAPSLRTLPTVIWHMPLSAYLDRTLSEIRRMKTHGEKRVRVVLEVFFVVHKTLENVAPQPHLAIRLAPGFVSPVEQWISNVMQGEDAPSVDEVREGLARPLLEQLKHDATDSTYDLAFGRIGFHGPAQPVRQQSQSRGLTRARVYQLLDACAKTAEVRWPEGRWQLTTLAEKLDHQQLRGEGVDLFNATRELFFPIRPADASANGNGR